MMGVPHQTTAQADKYFLGRSNEAIRAVEGINQDLFDEPEFKGRLLLGLRDLATLRLISSNKMLKLAKEVAIIHLSFSH